jgi:hypothetical protein
MRRRLMKPHEEGAFARDSALPCSAAAAAGESCQGPVLASAMENA